MNIFTDTTLIAATVNIVNTITNLIWSNKLKAAQGNHELLNALKDQVTDQKQVIDELMEKKNRYKLQYQNQLNINRKLEGELATYKKFHNHLS